MGPLPGWHEKHGKRVELLVFGSNAATQRKLVTLGADATVLYTEVHLKGSGFAVGKVGVQAGITELPQGR